MREPRDITQIDKLYNSALLRPLLYDEFIHPELLTTISKAIVASLA